MQWVWTECYLWERHCNYDRSVFSHCFHSAPLISFIPFLTLLIFLSFLLPTLRSIIPLFFSPLLITTINKKTVLHSSQEARLIFQLDWRLGCGKHLHSTLIFSSTIHIPHCISTYSFFCYIHEHRLSYSFLFDYTSLFPRLTV